MGLFPYTGRESGNLFVASRRMRKGFPPAEEMNVIPIIIGEPASHAVWALIQECWNMNHEERPDASNLLSRLEHIQQVAQGNSMIHGI